MSVELLTIGDGPYDAQTRAAAARLRDGGIVVLPTETVYGAAAALNHPAALERLRHLNSPSGGPRHALIPHLAKPADAAQFLGELNEFAHRCTRKLWPGPVALIFDVPADRRKAVADSFGLSESDLYTDGTITLRCPDHPVAADVIAQVGVPVAAVKAAGADQAAGGKDLVAKLDGKVDLILDAGPPRFSKPSTIVRVRDADYEIVR
jgi:L-threonylcarbamoyladenylate synthase